MALVSSSPRRVVVAQAIACFVIASLLVASDGLFGAPISQVSLVFLVSFFGVMSLLALNQLSKAQAANGRLYSQTEALIYLSHRFSADDFRRLPPLRNWAASPEFLRLICDLFDQEKPRNILELGSGATTVTLSNLIRESLPQSSIHVALDHDDRFVELTRARLDENAQTVVVLAPLKPFQINGTQWNWYSIENVPDSLDMIVIDGPPFSTQRLARYPALPLLYDRLRPGGIVVLDDAARPDEGEIVRLWLAEFDLACQYVDVERGAVVLTKLS